jgi:NAD+ diphosphatase
VIFAGAVLDRAPLERKRPEWLAEQRADPRARAILMSERGIWIDGSRLVLAAPTDDAVFLGLASGAPLFADDVRDSEPTEGHPAGLREAAAELPAREAALAGYAGSLLAWHRRHRFCANCGTPTEQRDGGHERHCSACDAHHFPRTDPVVIVRVTDVDDRLLLGRQERWADGRFSLLAGYVEPGRDARGGRPPRGARGVGGRTRRRVVSRLAALALPQLAHARLQRARPRRRRSGAG